MTLRIGEHYRVTKTGFVGELVRAGIVQDGNPIPRAKLEQKDKSGKVLEDWEGPETMLEEIDGSPGRTIEVPPAGDAPEDED